MYHMFLIMNNKDYEIPVLPESLTVKSPGKNETATIVKLGDVNILRKKGLREMTWESHFPANDAPYVTGRNALAPIEYVRAIQEARDAEKPIRFLIIGTDLDINILMGIEDFTYEEYGGEVGDIYYVLKLREWKEYSAKRISLPAPAVKVAVVAPVARSGSPPKPQTKTHTVVAGDSLWAIAKKYYNDGSQYPKIYESNKDTIDKRNKGTGNPKYTIYPGQVFNIP